MVKTSDVFAREIRITDGDYDIASLYKKIKSKVNDLDYIFFEKEHSVKSAKYGGEIIFHFEFVKEYDYFGMGKISIRILFYDVNKVKGKDHGNAIAKVKSQQIIDYKNKWGKNFFNKMLLTIYSKIKEKEFERKYEEPIAKASAELCEIIKDNFGMTS